MGLRAPGAIGGRCPPGPPGVCGRGRSNIGRLRGGAPGAFAGAEYVGRGPVCGIMTRRTGAAGAAGVAGAAAAAGAPGVAADGTAGAAGTGAVVVVTAGAGASATGAGGVAGATGAAATGFGATITGCATTGRSAAGVAVAAGAAVTGGRAITGPAGGLLAIAGPAAGLAAPGGATIFAPCRGCGTIFLGPCGAAGCWVCCCAGALAAAETFGTLADLAATGVRAACAAGGAATTAGRGATGGADFAAASACLRSRIAFSASPGLETFERSNFGLLSVAALDALAPPRPPVRYARTFSASSASIELECVFFSVTPTATSASRMDLLFTSSSRARSLIRTLLIRPFFSLPRRPLAAHCNLSRRGNRCYQYYL